MSLGKAVEFVDLAIEDEKLRELCNSGLPREQLFEILEFNEAEFDNAINMSLVKCQTMEDAEVYQQLRIWFSIL